MGQTIEANAILSQHVAARATFLRHNGGSAWFPHRLNEEGEVRCPVCGVGLKEIKARHGAYEDLPDLQCRYWICERSGVTFFGDAEGLAFVSHSQGVLNLAVEEKKDGATF